MFVFARLILVHVRRPPIGGSVSSKMMSGMASVMCTIALAIVSDRPVLVLCVSFDFTDLSFEGSLSLDIRNWYVSCKRYLWRYWFYVGG